ncbi:septum formation initiator family protein [Pseudarthrobacter sp. AL07]|uniref:FtsB family cell division protein n=1 Tax=unclassified Pseudarthrobacter TaxID=2647000 RepID=UPI002499D956|nr:MULTISPECIES: septum formation initiator family protein [unclassified Pseudarthrobacter]MDI3193499.1 septum formation initiator family protein [Pseudarthrobacter sp. AL20]MDI3207567.1 septum formation initiator family protein [Pseudarthrobacter sp. AL07]
MVTRRPKVPKAASRHQATTDPAAEAAGVIRADFGVAAGSAKGGTKGKTGRALNVGTSTTNTLRPAGKGKGNGHGGNTAGRMPKPDTKHDDTQPVPAKAFSGRMLALAVVMIAITIMLAPTVKIFFDKRAELAALSADIAARQAEQDGLRQQISRWQDPNYVKQQARDRINMVMPGESGYWVFGSDLPAGSSSSLTATAAQDPADLPWVDSLWESIRRAATD